MFFSKITLSNDAQRSEEFWKVFRDPYTLHQAIWGLFGDRADRKRDFLYRLDQYGKKPLIYAVSERQLSPSQAMWNIETKPYQPKIGAGTLLSFMLRANPVRTKRDDENKQHRHDVVMEAKTRLREEDRHQEDRKPLANLMQEEGGNWLSIRAERHGFAINPDTIQVDGYQQHKFFKGKKLVKFSSLDFNGILKVVDPASFIEALYKGLGPAKGFGCGLMIVKRV